LASAACGCARVLQSFPTRRSSDLGGGGVLNAILGSLVLATGATILAAVIAVPVVLFIHTYAGKSRLANTLRLTLDVMWGIPSIVDRKSTRLNSSHVKSAYAVFCLK